MSIHINKCVYFTIHLAIEFGYVTIVHSMLDIFCTTKLLIKLQKYFTILIVLSAAWDTEETTERSARKGQSKIQNTKIHNFWNILNCSDSVSV